jgi:hypothetical protein
MSVQAISVPRTASSNVFRIARVVGAALPRVLLGLIFCAAGLSGFLLISNPPPAPPGLAGVFQHVFFESRWVLFVDGVEFVAGVLLLLNRFVPLALTLLGAVISNILAFHITMQPSGLPVALVVTLLWILIALRHRASFSSLFVSKSL